MTKGSSVPASSVTVDLGDGAKVAEPLSWSSSRSLSGGGLPGQARAVTGSSVGSGSLTIWDKTGATPWNANPPRPGGAVSIDMTDDAEKMMDGGTWWREVARSRVRAISAPSLLSGERAIDFEDDVPRGDVTVPTMLAAGSMDACTVIDIAARQGGYYATRPPAATTIMSLPLVGSLRNEVGPDGSSTISDGARYGQTSWAEGQAMLTDSMITARINDDLTAGPQINYVVGLSTVILDNSTSPVVLHIDGEAGELLRVEVDLFGVTMHNALTSSGTTEDMSFLRRLEILRLSNRWDLYINGSYRANIAANPTTAVASVQVSATTAGLAGGLTVDENGTSVLGNGFTPNALISPAGSPIEAVIGASGDAWALIQDVAKATLSAAWIDERGYLVFRGRDQMRGGLIVDTVDVLDTMEDLPWSISADEVADRVEVTYRAPVVSRVVDDSLTIWESSDQVVVGAGKTVTIVRDIEGAADRPSPWERVEDTGTYPLGQRSRYAAWTAPPGESGAAPAASALDVTSEMVTPTRLRIRIRNTTGSTIWVYGLTARANTRALPGEPVSIISGADEATARAPFTHDAGSWVQDSASAAEIQSWLASSLMSPLPVIGPVSVAPDAERRLGDTIVADVRSSALGPDGEPIEAVKIKALLSGTSQSHTPGSLTQSFTLTALHSIENDLADYIARELAVGDDEADWASHMTALGLTTEADLAAFINKGGILP